MTEFRPDKTTYIRTHAVMTAAAMAGAMLVLWAIDNPHIWTGAVAGFAAVAVRGWYMQSEIMDEVWTLECNALKGPYQRYAALGDIAKLRTLGSAVQVITASGDKHLIKYQPDPKSVIATIESARTRKQTA
ncbi:hypothetical protein [Marivita hallyeonensis]|uniref:PH domain-containing protein n=1 Tax=Marivita hallyeonensis TaxID=996342 RepID=A0A1M5TS38_9RHOB|nr:hypothetical protein [Marivita hallyeonensis]SHH53213.1 hypothetical protein SAMN05443551_2330 [Marivita hallyeonensis]